MNINVKKIVTGFLAFTLLLGLMPGTLTQGATDTKETTKSIDAITPTGLSLSETEAKVDTYVKEYIGKIVPGAAVTVVKDGQVVLQKEYGYSDVDAKKEVDSEGTMFYYGNLSQIYTWTAVMQLVEQGKLDLNADILTYLPEEFATKLTEKLISVKPITLTNLMNHTAGFEETGHDTNFTDSANLKESLEQGLLITMPNQIYVPGEVMTGDSYSVSLAAYIIEQVSGMSYKEYLQNNIFDKLGAKNTVLIQNEADLSQLGDARAIQYLNQGSGNFVSEEESYSNLYPSNSIYGTASDLAKLMIQLMWGKEDSILLSKESLNTMYTESYAITEGANASLHGLYEYPADVKAYYCDGGTTSTSMMVMMPETGFGLVITTNTSAAIEMLYGLSYELLLGEEKAKVSTGDDLPSVATVTDREYVGTKRPYSGALEFLGYFANCSKFSRVNQDTISLGSDQYKQVSPYIYKYAGDNKSPLYKTIASTLYFKTDGTSMAYKWSYSASGTAEYVYDSQNKSQNYLSMTIFLLVVSIMFVVLAAIVSVLGLIKDAIKRRFTVKNVRFAYSVFTVLLFLSILNNWGAFSDISSAQGIMASSINVHIVLNIILSIVEFISLGYLVYRMRNERQRLVKNLVIVLTVMMYIGSVYFLQTWNFYTMIK